ncbi:uncharacterized protein LOC113233733 isoform X2 [Hyposmocoma kahamanoa]|uniref:uncharacterized protein LOC113233733 isoform X2 n=1 Tax=Hyposmocoma kahamanoa TaxID=1477025 RepID=UPI000E6D75FD|nr:uncharacterized protein LOC113233733 isoform X2 [Hyposmocoma kahamanoa]
MKVYLLLVVQLLAEAGIIWTIINVDEVVDFLSDKKNEWLFYVAVATPFGTYIALTYCCVSLRRKVPYNYIFLFIWTLPFGFTYGYFSAYKEIDPTMFTAMMITADACLGVTLVIFVPKCQFKALTGLFSVFGTFCTVYDQL